MAQPIFCDCTHIRRLDAQDLAEAIVQAIKASGRDLQVYLGADGAVGYQWLPPYDGREEEGMGVFHDAMDLVGRYDEEATAAQITEDILAMQREELHGKSAA